jgi:hypothetical protein
VLPGQVVYLDLDQDDQRGPDEPAATNDENGQYVFEDLEAGQYVVRLAVQEGWEQTYPADGGKMGLLDGSFACTIQLEPGRHRDDIHFGTRPADIGGTQIGMTIVHEPSTTGAKGEVAELPASAGWVHEWQSFWVELSGSAHRIR